MQVWDNGENLFISFLTNFSLLGQIIFLDIPLELCLFKEVKRPSVFKKFSYIFSLTLQNLTFHFKSLCNYMLILTPFRILIFACIMFHEITYSTCTMIIHLERSSLWTCTILIHKMEDSKTILETTNYFNL